MQVRWEPSSRSIWPIVLSPGDGKDGQSLDPAGIAALHEALETAGEARNCRVVVLTGAADNFCDGLDLASAREGRADRESVARFADCLLRIQKMAARSRNLPRHCC